MGIENETPTLPLEDVKMGMMWWNGLTRIERLNVLTEADRLRGWDGIDLTKASAAADGWALWKAGKIRMDGSTRSETGNHLI